MLAWLASLYPLPEDVLHSFIEPFGERMVKKREILLRAGQTCRNLYFVEAGLLLTSYYKGEREISACFTKEGEFCTSLESFFKQKPGIENIQAMGNSKIQCISFDKLQQLYQDFPACNKIGRLMMENFCLMQHRRFQAMWMQTARDRYQWLKEQHPWLLQQIPGKYVASFLGVTRGMMSRIKNAY